MVISVSAALRAVIDGEVLMGRISTILFLLSSITLGSCDSASSSAHDQDAQTAQMQAQQTQEQMEKEAAAAAAAEQQILRQRQADAITTILYADAQAGRLGTTRSTSAAMEAIDLSGAPLDFSEAFVIHRQAWEDAAEIDDQISYLNSEAAANEAWRRWWIETFRGSSETPVSDLEAAKARMQDRRREAGERIRTTFQTVERLAVRYGARLPVEEGHNSVGM